jgi:hypothetical protein
MGADVGVAAGSVSSTGTDERFITIGAWVGGTRVTMGTAKFSRAAELTNSSDRMLPLNVATPALADVGSLLPVLNRFSAVLLDGEFAVD